MLLIARCHVHVPLPAPALAHTYTLTQPKQINCHNDSDSAQRRDHRATFLSLLSTKESMVLAPFVGCHRKLDRCFDFFCACDLDLAALCFLFLDFFREVIGATCRPRIPTSLTPAITTQKLLSNVSEPTNIAKIGIFFIFCNSASTLSLKLSASSEPT